MKKYTCDTLKNLSIEIQRPCVMFLKWELWAGKTTLTQHIIKNLLGISAEVTSPTYTYYNKIQDIYHFDLYRLSSYDEFISIGGEEILDNNEGIVIIEWPELIEQYYTPDISIDLQKAPVEGEREIRVIYTSR